MYDPHSYSLAGKGLVRKINYSERNRFWEEIVYEFPRYVSVVSVAWVDYWIMLLGCTDGLLRVADHEKIRTCYHPLQLEALDIMADEDPTSFPKEEDGIVL